MKSRIVILFLIVIFFFGAHVSLEKLNEERSEFQLLSSPFESAPPELVIATTALGGFRGIIVDYLWIRAMELKLSGEFFELVQIYNWIGKMEPRMEMVWVHNAWNMAYNISAELPSGEERWIWIKQGIGLLRDEGLKYNPRSSMLHRELGWIYLHKIGNLYDKFHWHYKMKFAEEMEEVLGGGGSPPSAIESGREVAERLRKELKLDPERMVKLAEIYGPLDWRLPQPHAVYWITKGLEVSGEEPTLNHDRLVLHAIIDLFETGRIVRTEAGFILAGPDFRFLDSVDRIYGELSEKYGPESGLSAAHENFLQSAVMLLYTYGQNRKAIDGYTRLRKLKPNVYSLPLEDYVFARIKETVTEGSALEVSALIYGTLRQALLSLAIGDDEKSAGLENLAKLIWRKHMEKYGDSEDHRLPAFKVMRDSVVKRALEGEFSENLQNRLRERLGYVSETSE